MNSRYVTCRPDCVSAIEFPGFLGGRSGLGLQAGCENDCERLHDGANGGDEYDDHGGGADGAKLTSASRTAAGSREEGIASGKLGSRQVGWQLTG